MSKVALLLCLAALYACDNASVDEGPCQPACGVEQACIDGACVTTCINQDDCPGSDFCDAGFCRPSVCGDGKLTGLEQCDLGFGNTDNGFCKPNCRLGTCGDGFVLLGHETCDDGNTDDGDQCPGDCGVPGNGLCAGITCSRRGSCVIERWHDQYDLPR